MKDNAKIVIRGIQAAMGSEDDQKPIEVVTTGQWVQKGQRTFITYVDHTFVEGEETRTTIKLNENGSVSVIRFGDHQSHLLFEKEVSHIIPYQTPVGMMEIISYTTEIKKEESIHHLSLKVVYELEINHMDLGQNTFEVEVSALRNSPNVPT